MVIFNTWVKEKLARIRIHIPHNIDVPVRTGYRVPQSWADANVFASSRIRRKGILMTRWAKTQQSSKRRERKRRDVNFRVF